MPPFFVWPSGDVVFASRPETAAPRRIRRPKARGFFVHRAPAGSLRSSRRRVHNGFTIIITNPAALVNVRCALCILLVCGRQGRFLMSPFSKSVFYRILSAQKGRVQYDQCHIRNFYLYAFCNTDSLLAAREIVSIMRFGRNYLWKIGLKDYAMKLIKSFLRKNQIVSVCISLICTALHDFAHCWL